MMSGLEYLFRKATQEIFKFEDKKEVEKKCILIDGILYHKLRILEGATLRAFNGLSECIDLETFTCIKFQVPMISKSSPLAVSIAIHLHYDVIKHRGYETVHRLVMQHVGIFQGRQLFKKLQMIVYFVKRSASSM